MIKINTEDRRVRRTKKALTNALADLLAQKPLNNISVREISEVADINRGTFYLHYRDVYDMVEKLQDEIFEEFNNIVAIRDSEDLFSMLVDIFNLMAENSKLSVLLIGKNGDAAFVDRLRQHIKETCFPDIKAVFNIKTDKDLDYFYNYTVSGCIGLFTVWLNNGMKESPAEMAHLTEQLILNSAKTFK